MSKTSRRIALLLTRAARALERGHMQARAPETEDKDEMSRLCRSFNRMAEAMGKRDRERLHFMAMAAHDLGSPLFVISSAARELKRDLMPSEERTEWVDRIIRNAVAMEYIAADIKDHVQVQSGDLKLNCEKMDLARLARDVTCDYEASVQSHRFRFEGEGPCLIHGDAQRLRRVLLNLLSNAVKYSAAGREVCVTVWKRGEFVRLTVEDHGVGICPSEAETLFRPFVRLDRTKAMADGSGLGLLSTKRIVEAHGAEINVQGAPDQGTTFEICFKVLAENQGKRETE